MNEEQFKALLEYIDRRLDERIQDAFGRASGQEWLASYTAEQELREVFNL